MSRSNATLPPTDRRRRARGALFDIDRTVPALMFKIGSYPVHHGGVGLVRTLGRLGIDVFAVTEDAYTPAARSRYLREAIVWPTTVAEPAEELVDGLLDVGRRIGRRSVLYVTDEEAAILIAEHAYRLRERFYLADVPAGLPRQLASKWRLAELCREHGIDTPPSASPRSRAELVDAARSLGFPVALKNGEAWERIVNPAVSSTTVAHNVAELERLASGWRSMPSVIVQRYVPYESSEDWVTQIYAGSDTQRWLTFTGVKMRSWPAFTGATAVAYSARNATLADLTASLCRSTGLRGIAALDWRMDLRDGRYYLLDFNPRVGMNFRLFETSDGLDVVRAMHLDLTGRPLPVRSADRRPALHRRAVRGGSGDRVPLSADDSAGTGCAPADRGRACLGRSRRPSARSARRRAACESRGAHDGPAGRPVRAQVGRGRGAPPGRPHPPPLGARAPVAPARSGSPLRGERPTALIGHVAGRCAWWKGIRPVRTPQPSRHPGLRRPASSSWGTAPSWSRRSSMSAVGCPSRAGHLG